MQDGGAYIQQIPPGAQPPTATTPTLRMTPGGAPLARPPPPGVYVLVANARDQADAVAKALEASRRFGAFNPGHVRGVVASVEGEARILLFAGPFKSSVAVQRFCTQVLQDAACETRNFGASDLY